MALSLTSIGNYLFKRAQGKSSTSDTRQFFEETFNGNAPVYPSQVWAQADVIPNVAPALADLATAGVVKRYVNLQLTAVPGATNAFQSNSLRDCIPFNFGDGVSYNYALTDSTGAAIAFGAGDWIVDPATGTLTFYGTTPGNMPPKISFYQYVGAKGVVGTGSSSITLTEIAADPAPPAAGQDTIYFKTDGKLYRINSAGQVSKVGSGGGGGSGKNYLADLNDGSSVTGMRSFNGAPSYTFAAASNLVDTTADTIAIPTNTVATGQAVVYSTDGTAIGGLTGGSTYYARRISASAIALSLTQDLAIAGTNIDLTSQGTGNHTFAFNAVLGSNLGISTAAATGVSVAVYSGTTPLPIRPTSNQRISKIAGSQIGQGISFDVALDPAEYMNGFSLRLEMLLRGSANYASGDLSVQIYDLANNKPLKVGTTYQKALGLIKGIAYMTPTSTTTSVRVILTVSSTNANAWDLDLMDLSLSPLDLIVDHFRESAGAPTVPPVGITQVFAKPDGKLYRQSSTGVVRPIADAVGAAGKNYLADLADGTSIAGINPFDTPTSVIINGSNNPVDTLGDAINAANHNFGTGQQVLYTATFGAIGGLTTNTTYFVVRLSSSLFGLATTLQNAAGKVLIDLTSQGTNTQTFAVATSAFPSGTSPAVPAGVTVTLNTVLPLRTSNQRLSKDAANRTARGWSMDFALDRADVDGARQMKLVFKYRTSANYAANDINVHLLDLTNGFIVPMDSNLSVPLAPSTSTTISQWYFTPSLGAAAFRLVFTNVSTSALAYDIDLVDLEVSAASALITGAISTPFRVIGAQPVTVLSGTAPTKGAATVDRVSYSRAGEYMLYRWEAQFAAGAAGTATSDYIYTLPDGKQFDPAKVYFETGVFNNGASVWNTRGAILAGGLNDAGSQATVWIVPYDGTRFRLGLTWISSGGANRGYHGGTLFTYASAFSVGLNAVIPILGWDASTSYSSSEIALKNTPAFTQSALKTSPASGVWLALTGNALSLQPGMYDLIGQLDYLNAAATSPTYTYLQTGWFASNGADSSTSPAALSSIPGIQIFGVTSNARRVSNPENWSEFTPPLTIKLSQPATIYLVGNAQCTTPANTRIMASLVANKRPDYSAFGVYGQFDFRYVTSNVYTGVTSGIYPALVGNSHTLPVGTWRLKAKFAFLNNGTSPQYSNTARGIFGANGANVGTNPALISTLPNVDHLDPGNFYTGGSVPATFDFSSDPMEAVIRVKSGTATIYAVPFVQAAAVTNARVTVYMSAERLQ